MTKYVAHIMPRKSGKTARFIQYLRDNPDALGIVHNCHYKRQLYYQYCLDKNMLTTASTIGSLHKLLNSRHIVIDEASLLSLDLQEKIVSMIDQDYFNKVVAFGTLECNNQLILRIKELEDNQKVILEQEYKYSLAMLRKQPLFNTGETNMSEDLKLKIRIKDLEHFRQVEKALLDMGYEWLSSTSTFNNGNAQWDVVGLFIGDFKANKITWTEDLEHFNLSTNEEREVVFVESALLVPIEKETVELFGKTYDKQKLEEILSGALE